MDVKAVRRQNLLALLEECGREHLAREAQTAPAYLSQLKSRRTEAYVGHDLARRLEAAAGKPEGWMDLPHGDAEVIAEAVASLSARERLAVAAMLQRLVRDKGLVGRLARIIHGGVLAAAATGGIDELEPARHRHAGGTGGGGKAR
jgi:hypothetical protein